MANLLDICRFTAGSSGTGDFADGTAVAGFLNLDDAGAVNGRTYPYRAENATRSEWEIGYGIYDSGAGTLSRTPTKSSNSGSAVNFATNPVVLITPLAQDLFGREVLTAGRTYYVRTDGSDSNDGLANTSGGAFLTIQKAIDTVASLDLGIYNVTISVGAGTYTAANTLKKLIGAGGALIQGAGSTTVISVTSGNCFAGSGVSGWTLQSMKIQTTSSGNGIFAQDGAVVQFSDIEFGAVPNGAYHLRADANARITAIGAYAISGGASAHMLTVWGGHIAVVGRTVTLTGTPAFGTAFALASRLGKIEANGITYSGSATGVRYLSDNNSIIFTNGGGATYFPGNAAGSVNSGGIYS